MSGTTRRTSVGAILILALLAFLTRAASAQAPDATAPGPFATTSAEYKFPAVFDPEISPGLQTELWARVYRPSDLSQGPYPLLVFLHGNHSTCGIGSNPRNDNNSQYTFYGTCPPGYVVTPNHEGYTYLADRLASWGYFVVSLNVNRGINAAPGFFGDAGLNLVRGRMVLRHLQRLSEWNNTPGTTPASLGFDMAGLLDFSHVGLLGHSRGGEGVRAAYNQYRDPGSPWPDRIGPVNYEGIFEIGPVDGQTARTLNADGTAWNVLLPMCDGDVFDLEGIKPYDRMQAIRNENPTNKSTYAVWGANHNFYNTEWQISDSAGCVGPGNVALFSQPVGSPQQRQTSLASVMAFFRGNVATQDVSFYTNFDPLYDPPAIVTSVTKVDRGFTDSPNSNVTMTFEDFDKPTGTNSYGFANDATGITIAHRIGAVQFHDASQRAALISWSSPGGSFQTNWAAPGTGRDISSFFTLDLRISRRCRFEAIAEPPDPADPNCLNGPNPLNPAGPTNFSVQLVNSDGSVSDPVQLKDWIDLRGPVGTFNVQGSGLNVFKPIMMTARLPLWAFSDPDLTKVRGVRITFDDTSSGAVNLANIRLSTGTTSVGGGLAASAPGLSFDDQSQLTGAGSLIAPREIDDGNKIAIRTARSPNAPNNQPTIEVVVTSNQAFQVQNQLAVLRIGKQEFNISRYPETGEQTTLIFSLTADEFTALKDGDPVRVQYGSGEGIPVGWSFGNLNKSLLDR